MNNFDEYMMELKNTVDIVEVIGVDEPLTKRGMSWRGQRHDSLQVSPDKGLWNWHSRHIGGDVISWCREIRGWDFRRSVEELARLYNVEPPDWGRDDSVARLAAQARYDVMTVAARFWVKELRKNYHVRCYCARRGWLNETIKDEGLGYWSGDVASLSAEFTMHGIDVNDPVAKTCLRTPSRMLIYPHVEYGRVVYFSARSISGQKKDSMNPGHYNPPRDIVGDRKPKWNRYARRHDYIVIVEGQADVVTLTQWAIPSVALCGVAIGDTAEGSKLLHRLAKYNSIIVGVDNDNAGMGAVRKLSTALGPMVRVLTWPGHDANDWKQKDRKNATAEAAANLVASAEPYVMIWARRIGELEDYQKSPKLTELINEIARWMDDTERGVYRQPIFKALGISAKTYDKLLNTALESADDDDDSEIEKPSIVKIGGYIDGCFLETIYIPPPDQPSNAIVLEGGKTLFAIREEDGTIKTAEHFDGKYVRIIPMSPSSSILTENILTLPREVGPLLETRAIITKIKNLIHKYVDVDDFFETLCAYYVLFSWFYDCFSTIPYLRVKGDYGSGKSRVLFVVGPMCYRRLHMNAGSSISAMFRTMDGVRGTLVLDEGDFTKSDEASDVAKLLNVGNQRRNGYISRSGSRENNYDTELFNVFGPKVIATRLEFKDKAIKSRCLTKEMGAPTSREDIPRNLPDEFWSVEIPYIQSVLLRYRLEHLSEDINAREISVDKYIEPRLQQVTDSILKIIPDPAMAKEVRQFIRKYNDQIVAGRGLETEAKILEAIFVLYETQRNKDDDEIDYSMGAIAEIANDLIDYENGLDVHQWSRYKQQERKRAMSSRGVSGHVKTLQLETARKSSDQRRRFHLVWDHKRIEGLWARYGLSSNEDRMALMATYYQTQAEIQEYETKIKTDLQMQYNKPQYGTS